MRTSFLGLVFSPLQLDHGRLLSSFLNRNPQPLSGFTFATLAAWYPLFDYAWVLAEPGTLLISCVLDPSPQRHLLQPVGPLSPGLTQRLLKEAAALRYPLKIVGACDRFLKENPDLVRSFKVGEDRALSNYVYETSALAQLIGRKYGRKRNLLAQAAGQYSWTTHALTGALTNSCFEVLDSMTKEEHPLIEGMLKRELAALDCTLRHFDEFGQQGLLVEVSSRPVAFSIYEPMNPTTVAIHFERALRSYKGLYQVINWEVAKVIAAEGFELINREEDLGDLGLREAKLSYHPTEIVPAYELTYKK